MPYGTIKVDNIVFTNSGVDQTIGVSGLVQSVSGNLTVTGTISGNLIRGTTVSGATITGGVLTVASGIFSSGTVSAPSIGFTGDGNTGFWTPAGDTVALSTGGSERLRVDSDGDLGVGTTDPTSRLTVRADAASGPNTIIRVENRAASAGATTQNIKIEGIFDYNNSTSDASAGAIVFGKEGTYTTATTNNDSYLAFETATDNSSTEKLRINSVGQVVATISGTAAAPALSVGGDVNTGLYSPGADQVAISTNGTGRLFVDANGNVGVGTGSPTTLGGHSNMLNIFGSNATGIILGNSTDSTVYITKTSSDLNLRNGASGNIVFSTADTERMRLTSAGLLGLGTSSPAFALDISAPNDTIVRSRTNGNTSAGFIGSTNNGTNNWFIGSRKDSTGGTSGTDRFNLLYDTNAFLTVSTAGSVGIGTTSPGYTLDVRPTGLGLARIGSQDNQAGLYIGSGNAASPFINFLTSTSTLRATIYAGASSDDLIFGTGASGAERARIDSSGRLLVGTSTARNNLYNIGYTPSAQFETSGALTDRGLSITYNGGTTTGGPLLHLITSRGTTAGSNAIVASGDELGSINFLGTDGIKPLGSAAITAYVDGTPGVGSIPGRLVFSTAVDTAGTTEALRITSDKYLRMAASTGGIQFNGDTAAVNALDDYEEGTWTPTILGGSTNPTVSYSIQNGTYTKTGRLVTCRFYVQFSFTGGSGTVSIGGLPFASSSTANTYHEFNLPYAPYLVYPAGCSTIGLELNPGATSMMLFGMGNNIASYVPLTYGTNFISGTNTLFLAVVTYHV